MHTGNRSNKNPLMVSALPPSCSWHNLSNMSVILPPAYVWQISKQEKPYIISTITLPKAARPRATGGRIERARRQVLSYTQDWCTEPLGHKYLADANLGGHCLISVLTIFLAVYSGRCCAQYLLQLSSGKCYGMRFENDISTAYGAQLHMPRGAVQW